MELVIDIGTWGKILQGGSIF